MNLRSHHINYLELRAILWALQKFQSQLSGHTVQVLSDNTTAVYCLNKQGGTASRTLCCLALALWDLCILKNITTVASHLPRKDNALADVVSRGALSLHELQVDPTTLLPVFHRWGTPIINVFATAAKKQCHLFCDRGWSDPRSLGDGLLLDWTGEYLYMFPPLPLLPRILLKFLRERPCCILVTPWWPRQIWFPTLLELSKGRYIQVKETQLPVGLVPDYPTPLKLTAWLLD